MRTTRPRRGRLLAACTGSALLSALCALSLAAHSPALAAGVVVPACTEAGLDAALAGGGAVTFSCGGPVTITFSAEKLITLPTTIDGANGGLGAVTFSGGGSVRLLHVAAGAQLTLTGLVLVDGNAAAQGGAVLVDAGGTLIVQHARFERNRAANFGGAIGNYGDALVMDTTFFSNSAPLNGGAIDSTGRLVLDADTFDLNFAGSRGGALNNYLGVVEQSPPSAMPSAFTRNSSGAYGGALVNDQGALTLTAVFTDNHSSGAGGAFKNSGYASITGSFALNSSTGGDGGAIWNDVALLVGPASFSSNQAAQGGALYTDALLTVTQSSFDANSASAKGGAIFVAAPAHLTLHASVFSAHTSLQGVTVYALGPADIAGSTFYANGSNVSGNGGGVETWARLDVLNSTFSQNHGYHAGAISMQNGVVFITNTTLLSNTAGAAGTNGGSILLSGAALTSSLHILNSVLAGGAPNNCSAGLTSLGGNAEDANSCGLTQPSDQHGIDPRLGPLQPNPGAAGTVALTQLPLPGSPLIDAAMLAGCPPSDERGHDRPSGAGCDVGAVEITPPLWLPLVLR